MIEQVSICIRNKNELNEMLRDIVESTWFSEGKYCQEYLKLIKSHLNSKNVFLAPNGTLGLYLALISLSERAPEGGDVLVPSFTFYGSATSIKFAGFNPVFVDCCPATFQSRLIDFKNAKTEKTVGVMPVHIYGQVGEIEEICGWARDEGFFTVEDAAQAFGCLKNGKPAGTFADIGVYSTFSDKIYTTGEGAILTVNDDELAEKVRLIRNQGRPNAGTFLHPELGMNFRLTEFQAALGLHQLRSLNDELTDRRRRYSYYQDKIKMTPAIRTMELVEGSNLVPFRFPILLEDRESVKLALEQAGVQLRDFFVPMHLQPQFKELSRWDLPNCTNISQKGMCLPVHHRIEDRDIDLIFEVLNQ